MIFKLLPKVDTSDIFLKEKVLTCLETFLPERRQMSLELLQIKNNQRQIEEKIFGLEKVAENSSPELPEDVELPFNTVEKL